MDACAVLLQVDGRWHIWNQLSAFDAVTDLKIMMPHRQSDTYPPVFRVAQFGTPLADYGNFARPRMRTRNRTFNGIQDFRIFKARWDIDGHRARNAIEPDTIDDYGTRLRFRRREQGATAQTGADTKHNQRSLDFHGA